MIQQVNLLGKNGQADKPLLKNPYLQITALVCLSLLGISAIGAYQLHQQRNRHRQLEQRLQAAAGHLTEIQTRFPRQAIDNTLLQALQQARQRQQNLSQILELLTDDRSDQALGFSRYLSALADQADREVWLTRIRLDSASRDIDLQGSTFKPEQIPALLKNLQTSPAFKGRHFAKLIMRQNSDNGAQTDFRVSSNLKPEAETTDAE